MGLVKSKLVKIITDNSRISILTALSLAGIMLLVFSNIFDNSSQKSSYASNYNELDIYKANLESSLTQAVSKINGAGITSVMITLEGSFETVYASNARLDETSDSGKTTEKQLATISDSDRGQEPVVVKKLSPKIRGVLIVCQGGENSSIKQDIINAAATALNISTSRIYVTGGNLHEKSN